MAVIRPFRALRPQADRAQQVASVPYDVVNTEEARTLAEGNPLSFLHVSRPEIDLPPGTDLYSDAVYRKAVENFEKLIVTCPLEKEAEPSLYLYRLIMGPSGVTLVILRDELLQRIPENLPTMLDYGIHVENKSLYNTPNTWGIYILSLVCKWLQQKGGLAGMERENDEKAQLVYDAIDATDFYRGHADADCRSTMNVTYRLPSEELEKKFVTEATAQGLDGLKGHRSVGGIRASIYNAFPRAGVEALVSFMKDFERRNG